MKVSAVATALAVFIAVSPLLLPGEPLEVDRGRSLYDTHCGHCHSQSVHGRTKRVATDFNDIRNWVYRWRNNLSLGWNDDEVDAVAVYLNNTYYHFGCPPDVCKVISRAP